MRWSLLGGVCCGVMHAQRPGGRVAVRGSCGCDVLFSTCVVLLACGGGLTFLACACAFGGFLLWFLFISISQLLVSW